jgi:hypothetical protein
VPLGEVEVTVSVGRGNRTIFLSKGGIRRGLGSRHNQVSLHRRRSQNAVLSPAGSSRRRWIEVTRSSGELGHHVAWLISFQTTNSFRL